MITFDVNYLAIFVAAIAAMVLGTIWYMPLFGKAWLRYMGLDNLSEEEMRAKNSSAMRAHGIGFVMMLIVGFVVSNMFAVFGPFTMGEVVFRALFVGIGIVSTLGFMNHSYAGKPNGLFAIDYGYKVVVLLLIAVVIRLFS